MNLLDEPQTLQKFYRPLENVAPAWGVHFYQLENFYGKYKKACLRVHMGDPSLSLATGCAEAGPKRRPEGQGCSDCRLSAHDHKSSQILAGPDIGKPTGPLLGVSFSFPCSLGYVASVLPLLSLHTCSLLPTSASLCTWLLRVALQSVVARLLFRDPMATLLGRDSDPIVWVKLYMPDLTTKVIPYNQGCCWTLNGVWGSLRVWQWL